MKSLTLFLVIAMLIMPGNSLKGGLPNEVILTADQVDGANDIEFAIETATANGTRPGIVTLDASKGDFVYTDADRSINIYVSNLTLRSKNGAVIANCGDGVYFDNATTNKITITGITFICEGCGVNANTAGLHKKVEIRHNVFTTGSFAIEALNGDGWRISGNSVPASANAINLYDTSGAYIHDNLLTGFIGIYMSNSGPENVVMNNKITAQWQGILLSGTAVGNEISGNRITKVQSSGIAINEGVTGNRITGNLVFCATGFDCKAVDSPEVNYRQNTISGNRVIGLR